MHTIQQTIASISPELPEDVAKEVLQRWNDLTKPRGSLGILESSIVRLAQIQGTARPRIEKRGIFVFCGDHGITAEGVSPYPSVVTREMVKNFVRGGAAINVLCRQWGLETSVVDAGVAGPPLEGVLNKRVAEGTRNFLQEPAMSREQATTALERGIELAREAANHLHIAGVGEMGIGNSTAASALLCIFTGAKTEDAVGRGAGLDDAGLQHKQEVLTEALARHSVNKGDPLGIAATFGGFEIVMMAGFLLGAASVRLPVVIDGFISGAAFLIARAFSPAVGNYVFWGHRSAERGHALLLAAAQARPLLDLEMRLGEGTGAAIAIGLLSSGVYLYREMATFAEASVSDRDKEEQNK